MAKQKEKRPYHHGDLKRALLDASLALVREEGVEALTVAEVGRRVGVSSAAPYKHFSDRQALLRAVALEANHLLNQAIGEAIASTADAREAFRLSGVVYIGFAADNPSLYRLITDPTLLDYASPPGDAKAPGPLEGTMETFWTDLAQLLASGEALSPGHPLIEQLRGRALAYGVASLFASGTFAALGVGSDEAERVARVVTGEEVPARSRG